MKLAELPAEVVAQVFAYVSPNVLYDKLLAHLDCESLSELQLLAYRCIVSGTIIIKGGHHGKRAYPTRIFHTAEEVSTAFTVNSMQQGYTMIRDIMMYNMKSSNPVVPRELGMYYRADGKLAEKYMEQEALAMVKLLELLAVDYARTIGQINVQLVFTEHPSDSLKHLRRKITSRMLVLDRRLSKLFFHCEFTDLPFYDHLQFMSQRYQNLKQAYFWNDGIHDVSLPRGSSCPPNLELLDISGNSLTSLLRIPVSASVNTLVVKANGLKSLEGLEFKLLKSLQVLDVSVNVISSLEGIYLPPTLRVLDVSFNSISKTGFVMLPPQLETLKLSRNSILSLSHLELPSSLQKLQLDSNNITALPATLFERCPNLTVLDLSDNKIDDLDELGRLPDSLKHLKLDGNQIDYSNLTNILVPNLRTLSMVSTGLVSLTHVQFPQHLTDVNFSKNEISEFTSISFGAKLVRLDLRYNKIEMYDTELQHISIPASAAVYLDHNPLQATTAN